MLRNKLRFLEYSSFAGEMVCKNFAIFGASSAGRRTVQHLAPLRPKFCLDNNQQLIGGSISGVLVLAPSRELLINLDSLIIASLNYFPIAYGLNFESSLAFEFLVPPVEIIYGHC